MSKIEQKMPPLGRWRGAEWVPARAESFELHYRGPRQTGWMMVTDWSYLSDSVWAEAETMVRERLRAFPTFKYRMVRLLQADSHFYVDVLASWPDDSEGV